MRIYIAAAYSRKFSVQDAAAILEAKGHDVVSTWHQEIYLPTVQLKELSPGVLRDLAFRDIKELSDCDTLVFFAEPQESQPPRGGRHVEFGIALALGKRIIVIGEAENLFHYWPKVEVMDSLDGVV
jgi:nucleoside 2-deoxyribosyltransferase